MNRREVLQSLPFLAVGTLSGCQRKSLSPNPKPEYQSRKEPIISIQKGQLGCTGNLCIFPYSALKTISINTEEYSNLLKSPRLKLDTSYRHIFILTQTQEETPNAHKSAIEHLPLSGDTPLGSFIVFQSPSTSSREYLSLKLSLNIMLVLAAVQKFGNKTDQYLNSPEFTKWREEFSKNTANLLLTNEVPTFAKVVEIDKHAKPALVV